MVGRREEGGEVIPWEVVKRDFDEVYSQWER